MITRHHIQYTNVYAQNTHSSKTQVHIRINICHFLPSRSVAIIVLKHNYSNISFCLSGLYRRSKRSFTILSHISLSTHAPIPSTPYRTLSQIKTTNPSDAYERFQLSSSNSSRAPIQPIARPKNASMPKDVLCFECPFESWCHGFVRPGRHNGRI